MSLVAVIAPYRTATSEENARLAQVKLDLISKGDVPIFLPHALADCYDDEDPDDRDKTLAVSALFLRAIAEAGGRCVELDGRVTNGMALDRAAWFGATGAWPEIVTVP